MAGFIRVVLAVVVLAACGGTALAGKNFGTRRAVPAAVPSAGERAGQVTTDLGNFG